MKSPTNKELFPVVYCEKPVRAIHVHQNSAFLCFAEHWHERVELLRMNEGELHFKRGDESVVLKKGEMGIVCSEQLHRGVAGNNGADYDVLMFDVSYFLNSTVPSFKYLEPLVNFTATFNIKTDNEKIIECFDKLYSMCTVGRSHSLLIISAVYEILGLLWEHCLFTFKKSPSPSDIKFGNVIKYINENFKNKISVENVSHEFGYNKSYFCRKFKEITGTNIMNYILILRLEESIKLLKDTNESISDISEKCGFGDFPYFCRSFKRHYGETPREYRKSAKLRE